MNTVTVKIQTDVKKQAQFIAEEFGITLSSLVDSLLKQVIKTKKISLDISGEEPNEYLKKIIHQAEKDYKKGNTSPIFNNAEDFVEFLHK